MALANEAETNTTRPDTPSEEEGPGRLLVNAHQAAMEKVAQKAFHSLPLTRQPTPEDQAILEMAQTGLGKPGVSPFASDALKVVPPAPPVAAALPAPAASAAPVQVAQTAPIPPPPAAPAVVPAPVIPAKAPEPLPAAGAAAPVPAERVGEIKAVVEAWRTAWERGRLDEYLAHYADGAVQGNLKGKDAIRRQKSGLWQGREPGRVAMDVLAVAPDGDGYSVVCAMHYQGKGAGRDSAGFKTLALAPTGGKLLIAKERWSKNRPETAPVSVLAAAPAATAAVIASAPAAPAVNVAAASPTSAQPAAPALAPAPATVPPAPVPPLQTAPRPADTAQAQKVERSAAAAAMVEAWRAAWERGRVTEYASFYADAAIQGDRRGRESIRSQKADLWKDKAPRKVAFSDLKITPRQGGYVVTFIQDYESRDGTADRGKKTLYLAPAGNGFSIVEEKWSRM